MRKSISSDQGLLGRQCASVGADHRQETAFTWLRENRLAALVGIDDLNEVDRISAEQGGSRAPPATTPETELIARADAMQLERMIAALPLEFRETLVLRDIQGLNYREIADITGAPLGTVMSRLARARQRLIVEIKKGGA